MLTYFRKLATLAIVAVLMSGIPATAAEPGERERLLYCQYLKQSKEVRATIDDEFGANILESLKPGDIVQAKAVVPLGIAAKGGGSDETTSAVTIPVGGSIQIIERVRNRRNAMVYLAKWVGRNQSGYITPAALGFLADDGARVIAHASAADSALSDRLSRIRKELFGDAYAAIEAHAIGAGWRRTCPPA